MTAVDKVALVRQIDEAASQEATEARDQRLSELIIDLVDSDPGPALLVLWNILPIEREAVVARSISFAMARHGERIGIFGCPALSSLLSSPVISDTTTLLNTLASIELADPSNPVQLGVLQSDLGGFVMRYLSRPERPTDALLSFLIRLADLKLLHSVFSKSQAAQIRLQLEA